MTARIEIIDDDITTLDVDAIVNAVNREFLRSGGVCGAIHAAAGSDLELACRILGGCPTDQARITVGFAPRTCHVIHAVGPVWRRGRGWRTGVFRGAVRRLARRPGRRARKQQTASKRGAPYPGEFRGASLF